MRSSASTSAAPNPPAPPSRGNRVSELFRKYGKVAIGVHLVVYTTFLAGKTIVHLQLSSCTVCGVSGKRVTSQDKSLLGRRFPTQDAMSLWTKS